MTSEPRHNSRPALLTEDELAKVTGGATEELKGSYNFLLEDAGTGPDRAAKRFLPPIGSDKGS